MERLTRIVARAAAAASLALLVFALVGCPNLSLRDFVEQKVLEYDLSLNPRPVLVLKDGTTTIPVNGTVTMPNTIFLDPGPKTLTIYNQGNLPLTLSSPTAVGEVSDPGSAYTQVQPVQFTVPAASSVAFSVTFTPPAADADYSVNLVINSDDPTNGAYNFSVTGHSTQWHGMGTVVASAASAPQIAVSGLSANATYSDGSAIVMRKSSNGGKTWTTYPFWSSSATITNSRYHSSILSPAGNYYIFYWDEGVNLVRFAKWFSGYPYIDSIWSSPLAVDFQVWQGIQNASILLDGGFIYLCYWDNPNSKLRLARLTDASSPSGGWSPVVYDITNGTSQTGGFYPSMKIRGTTVYVSYLDGKSLKIAKASTSNLSSWNYYGVYTDPTSNIGGATLVADAAKGHIIYFLSDGVQGLRHASSTDGLGMTTWTTDSTLSGETADQSYPLVFSLSGTTLWGMYNSYYTGSFYGVRLVKSTDGGSTWTKQWVDTDLSTSPANVSLAVAGSDVYAVYNTPSSHPNGSSITIMKSLDGGVTW
jgi:hypothetical protein